ncbi:MAG: hypothetical protein AAFR67_09230, partial [Chloroflexota bacterium]
VDMRMRLADSPETVILIDVSSVGTEGELATIELEPDFLRMGDYSVEMEWLENLLDSSFSPPERDTWFELRITVEGNEVTVFVDGEERLQADDFTHIDENFIGIFVNRGTVDIDYIRVYELDN